MSSLRAAATLAMLRAWGPRRAMMASRACRIGVPAGVRWTAPGQRPAQRPRALLGDPAAVHRGVGFVVGGRESGPTRQLGGTSEAAHVADLGDEHRRQHRPDAGCLLECLIAAMVAEPFGDQPGEPRFVAIEDVNEVQQ